MALSPAQKNLLAALGFHPAAGSLTPATYRLLDAYQEAIDALCPTPALWPKGASYCYLNHSGFPLFEFSDPADRAAHLAANSSYEPVRIPQGLDYRACGWSLQRAQHLRKP